MYLDVHEHVRAWKGYPWDVLDVLHEHGLISDPKSKAKSVVLTQEGLARAETAFNALLAIPKTPIPEPVQRPLAASGSGRLSELQLVQVDRLLVPICKPHPDPKVSSKLRLGYRIADYSVILFESRPAFMPPHDWLEQEVAKFRFVKTRQAWQLFCMFRDLKWHAYEPLPESPALEVLVSEVTKDPTGIFWG
jgi:hypothetical protein